MLWDIRSISYTCSSIVIYQESVFSKHGYAKRIYGQLSNVLPLAVSLFWDKETIAIAKSIWNNSLLQSKMQSSKHIYFFNLKGRKFSSSK